MSSMCIQFPSFPPRHGHEIESQYEYQQISDLYQRHGKLSCILHSLDTVFQRLVSMYTPHSNDYLFRPQSGSVSLSRYPPTVTDVAIRSACSQSRNYTGNSANPDFSKNGLSLRNVLQKVNSISELQNIVSHANLFSSKSRPSSGKQHLSASPKTMPISSDTCLAQIGISRNKCDDDDENSVTADSCLQTRDAVSLISVSGITEYRQSAKPRCSVSLIPQSPVPIKIPDVQLKEDVNDRDAYHRSRRIILTGKKHRRVKSEHRASKSKIKLLKTGRMAAHSKEKTDTRNVNNVCVDIQAQAKPLTMHKPVKNVLSRYTNDFNTRDNVTFSKTYSLSTAYSSQSKSLNLPQMKNNYIMEKSENPLSKENLSENDVTIKSHFAFSCPYSTTSSEVTRVSKIYFSDRQSGMIRDCGMDVPCAPPTSPTTEQMIKYEYVPCMNDIKAQRAVKMKLQVLEKEAHKRLERAKEEKAKVHKNIQKQQEKALKVRQRQEIYALNTVMTELENLRFLDFCRTKGLNT